MVIMYISRYDSRYVSDETVIDPPICGHELLNVTPGEVQEHGTYMA